VDALNALEALSTGFGVLSMPCGTGKTHIMTLTASRFDKIVVTIPTRVLVDQFSERTFPHLMRRGYTCLVVDSGGSGTTRNPSDVQDTWKSPKCFIVCTLVSFQDVIAENIVLTELSICMIDEAHNMTKNIQDIATRLFPRVLLATATPLSTWTFPIIYHMSSKTAISDGWTCDYRVFVPIVEGEMACEVEAAARFFSDGLFRYGKHAMCFASTIKDCEKIKGYIDLFTKTFHFTDVWTDIITCHTTPTRTKGILADFDEQCAAGNYAILIVPQLFSEGFDNHHVDTVMLRHCSDISFVQRISRANRIDPMRPSKVATVLLWAPDNAPKILHALKSHDPDYYKKVNKMSAKIYNDDVDTITEMAFESSTSVQFQNTCKVKVVTPEEKEADLQFKIEKLASYTEEHQKVPPQGAHELGHFAHDIRQGRYKITSAQHDLLVAAWSSFFIVKKIAKKGEIPFYEALVHYVTTEKKIPVRSTKIDFQGFSDVAIGNYLSQLKPPNSSYRANLGAEKETALLTLMPTIFDTQQVKMKYEEKIAIFKKYIETNRKTPPCTKAKKVEYEKTYGFDIGKFWDKMKSSKKIPTDIQLLIKK
jgi:superfamily II DNA or RNA helicase